VDGISDSMLSDRLAELCAAGARRAEGDRGTAAGRAIWAFARGPGPSVGPRTDHVLGRAIPPGL